MRFSSCLPLLITCLISLQAAVAGDLEAVTFDGSSAAWHLPIREVAAQLHWRIKVNEAGKCTTVNNLEIKPGELHFLPDGTELADQVLVAKAGAAISQVRDPARFTVRYGFRGFTLNIPAKRVEVSLGNQQLQAWQGHRLVLRTRISSGRGGSTPRGEFHAGPFKARMHYSSRYHNAAMPWSVQVNGNIFIHGFASVPDYPASHGCIRLPLTGGNPARWFYEWVENGTPVSIIRGGTESPDDRPKHQAIGMLESNKEDRLSVGTIPLAQLPIRIPFISGGLAEVTFGIPPSATHSTRIRSASGPMPQP